MPFLELELEEEEMADKGKRKAEPVDEEAPSRGDEEAPAKQAKSAADLVDSRRWRALKKGKAGGGPVIYWRAQLMHNYLCQAITYYFSVACSIVMVSCCLIIPIIACLFSDSANCHLLELLVHESFVLPTHILAGCLETSAWWITGLSCMPARRRSAPAHLWSSLSTWRALPALR